METEKQFQFKIPVRRPTRNFIAVECTSLEFRVHVPSQEIHLRVISMEMTLSKKRRWKSELCLPKNIHIVLRKLTLSLYFDKCTPIFLC